VTSHVTREFVNCFNRLPKRIQAQSRKKYKLWSQDPSHPSLQFKRVHQKPIYSVRIAIGWRVLGTLADEDTMLWFWIGPHSTYDRLLRQL